MSRILAVFALVSGTALMALPTDAQPTAEATRLANLFPSYLDEESARHPVYATQQGNHEHDDRMDDLSPEARKKDIERTRSILADLAKEIDPAKLSRNGQIDFEIWKHSLSYSLWLVENDNRFENDPRVYGENSPGSALILFPRPTRPRTGRATKPAKPIAPIRAR